MLKPTVKRGLMLDFIPDEVTCVPEINKNRVFELNDKPLQDGDIVYLVTREFRLEDNWAIIFGVQLAMLYNRKFEIITVLNQVQCSNRQIDFFNEGLDLFKKNAMKHNIDFEIVDKIPENIGALIVDFNPIKSRSELTKELNYKVFEVDSHNIIPARFISDKQEFSAATLRRKIYGNIAGFLTEYPHSFDIEASQADNKLSEFINNRLDSYAELKNDPNQDVTSNLSPYMHFGFISSHRIALEVLKSNVSRENKEVFLEELIVRKELADNFCLYNHNYNNLKGAPLWAQTSLSEHKSDIRSYVYSLNEFEHAKTHDEFWNAIQRSLLKTGRIHGFLRMYWAKKILEWSNSPEDALETVIYLNDEYALDGKDSNGYVGILWSIGAIHDRPFANRFVTGKVRYMSLDGCKKKFDVAQFVKNN